VIQIFLNPHKLKSFLITTLFSAFLFSFISCSPALRTGKKQTNRYTSKSIIKVFVDEFSEPRSISFTADVDLEISGKIVKLKKGTAVNLRIIEGEIRLRYGREESMTQFFSAEPLSGVLNFNGRDYSGELAFLTKNSKILVVNYLDVEEYLKGVLSAEMGIAANENDFEALKAFAVCARNYSVMKMNENKKHFDIYPDTRDQVYRLTNYNTYIERAIKETSGLVLENGNDLAKIFYYSSCGGRTEDFRNVFSGIDQNHLQSIEDGQDHYCKISPSYSWSERYSFQEIITHLRNANLITGDYNIFKSIDVKSRFRSGRINELEIIVSNGNNPKSVTLKGNNIRSVIRARSRGLLRSTLCDISTGNDEVIIEGRGYGHGVGLCQWGAIGQSRKGKKFREILYFYFPGTRLQNYNAMISGL